MFPADSIRARGLRLALQPGSKTAAETSFERHIKINLANWAVSTPSRPIISACDLHTRVRVLAC